MLGYYDIREARPKLDRIGPFIEILDGTEGGNALIRTTTELCLAIGLLSLVELSAPDMTMRLRIIGLTTSSGILVSTAQFAIDIPAIADDLYAR